MTTTTRTGGAFQAAFAPVPEVFSEAAKSLPISDTHIDRRPADMPRTGDHRTATRAQYDAATRYMKGDLP
jgi:hypothetical protein